MRIKLHNLIFVGMALGVVIGLGLYYGNESMGRTSLAIKAVFDSPADADGVLEILHKGRALHIGEQQVKTGVPMTLKAGENRIDETTRVYAAVAEKLKPLLDASADPAGDFEVVFVPHQADARPLTARTSALNVLKPAAGGWIAFHEHTLWWLNLLGQVIFMGALKMIIAPLILASIVAGVTSLPNMKELGSIGWKTMVYYACTTTIAVVIGLVFVLAIQPGKKEASQVFRGKAERRQNELLAQYEIDREKSALDDDGDPRPDFVLYLASKKSAEQAGGAEQDRFAKITNAKDRSPGDIFKEDIVLKLLMNPFEALSTRNSLGIIFFALLLGVACTVVGEEHAGPVIRFFQGLNTVILKITHWLMSISPFAITCIMGYLVAENGPRIFEALGWYCGTVLAGIAVHVVLLLAICAVIGGIGPVRLFRGIREAWMIAFTTRSSAATLPVTIANVTEKLKVSPKVANFSLPLGATMNMDGTALYEGIAIIFLIQIFGGLHDVPIEMTGMTTLLIFITAVLASVGAAAVPDAGLVTMVLVATAVHLPVYYIPIIFAVDAFLDMFRTSTNVLGDSIGAIVINRLERKNLGEA